LPRKALWIPALLIIAVLAFMSIPGCAVYVAEQRVPAYAIEADAEDFAVADDVAVLHYYGVGGWGIKWRGEYLLAAPYFSNHGFLSYYGKNGPDIDAVRKGVRNTPFGDTGLILVGHGHVDHAADIPAYAEAGLPANQAGVIANPTTLNMLAELMPPNESFRCAEAPLEDGRPIEGCNLNGFRITPLASHHAPNIKILGMPITVSTGTVEEPQENIPERPSGHRAGMTWAYLIDLLDENGDVAFRIHYMDAVAGSDDSSIPAGLMNERSVDVHIACVPGFAYVKDYPEWVMEQGNTGYVLLGHWEDFFQPRDDRLKPVTVVLSESKLNRFTKRVEGSISDDAVRVAPLNKSTDDCPVDGERCGPRGDAWAMPVPGETYHFGVRAGL
jgi:hypothetical protein